MGASSDEAMEQEQIVPNGIKRIEDKLDFVLYDAKQAMEKAQRRKSISQTLQNSITATENALKEKRAWESKKQDIQDLQKEQETKIRADINDEMADGKKRYTNQEQRDAAVFMRLNADNGYTGLKKDFYETTQKLTEIYDLLEILKMKFRAAQAEIELERLEI